MGRTDLVLANGGATSSMAVIRGGRALVVGVSSVATGVGLSFSADSGATWFPLFKGDGSAGRWLASSGGTACLAVLERVPTPWVRVDATTTWGAVTSAFVLDATL